MRTANCCGACGRVVGPDVCRSSRASTITRTSRRRWPTQASALVAYRTYPHVDMAESGARAARCLHDLLGSRRPYAALRQLDFLIPLTSQSTLVEPMHSLMLHGADARRAQPGCVAVCGDARVSGRGRGRMRPERFTPAAGMTTSATNRAAARLAAAVRAREPEFALDLHSIDGGRAAARLRHAVPSAAGR